MSILFFHGLNSSAETDKFTVIDYENKNAVTVDYFKLSFHEIGLLYDKLIQKWNPSMLVGHSLGGYWAIKKSHEHKIPCLAINPTLYPAILFHDYIDLRELDYDDGVIRSFHLELDDEIIDQNEVSEWIQENIENLNLFTYASGHHRVEYKEEINTAVYDLFNSI